MEQAFEQRKVKVEKHLCKREYRTKSEEPGVRYYAIFTDWKGKSRTFPLGSDLDDARHELNVLHKRNEARWDFDKERAERDRGKVQAMTLARWAEKYLSLVRAKRSWARDKEHCAHLKDILGPLPLSEITRAKIMEYKNLRLESAIMRHGAPVAGKTVKISTVNRELSCLRHMLNLAADEGLIESVPKFKLDPERHLARERVLSELEEASLIEKSPRWLQRVIIGAVESAMDRSDIIRLSWDQVNRKRGVIKLTGGRTKTGVKAIIPIDPLPRLSRLLRDLWQERKKLSSMENLVFTEDGKPISPSSLRKAFEKAAAQAELKDLRFKDLRHTAKTRWAERGVPVEAAMAAAGHSSVQMHLRYVNLNDERIIEAFKIGTTLVRENDRDIKEPVTA